MIIQNLKAIKNEIGNTKLLVVTKNRSIEELYELYNCGQRMFGENRVQELVTKYELLPKDIKWHLIGHLQTNKVKYIAPFVHMIHSVDSLKVLKEINKQAKKHNRSIGILFQVHIAEEESKFGFNREELLEVINNPILDEMSNVEFCGLMGMATNTDNSDQVEQEFTDLKKLFEIVRDLKNEWKTFTELSMGMSQDCQIAVKCGSTMVRIGSRIFKQNSC